MIPETIQQSTRGTFLLTVWIRQWRIRWVGRHFDVKSVVSNDLALPNVGLSSLGWMKRRYTSPTNNVITRKPLRSAFEFSPVERHSPAQNNGSRRSQLPIEVETAPRFASNPPNIKNETLGSIDIG